MRVEEEAHVVLVVWDGAEDGACHMLLLELEERATFKGLYGEVGGAGGF